ncbi:MAG: Gfo/Idh/MocA family oxidoreductase [Bryobacteraceae bacterium]|nr:Gfo/Idh/MocA family oxidoreductase [Bryobacteraceae bacterium]
MNRRDFLYLGAAPLAATRRLGANERLTIACMGCRGRAGSLIAGFAEMPDVDIATLIDVDANQFGAAVQKVESRKGRAPKTVGDFRRVLEDKSIDAIVIGTPEHWHAIPAILACQAGKHVYVEKPLGHNHREGEAMLAAARKYKRVMQVGIQSRSGPHFAQALEYIRSGGLGRVALAKAWESARQRPVPRVPDSAPPAGVDYDMWLGPAPRRAFNPARFHSNWRWFFDYGSGDLGNDGVHRIDYARRGLEAAFQGMGKQLPEWPLSVAASGGKLYFDDAQEWPDTLFVTWDYPGALLTYEMRIWSPHPIDGEQEGAAVYGDNGWVLIGNRGWQAYGPKGEKLPARGESGDDDPAHKRNWVDTIRKGGTPNCDVAVGHVASSMVHFGNIAWRVNRKLQLDAMGRAFRADEEANQKLARTYRAPWMLPKV